MKAITILAALAFASVLRADDVLVYDFNDSYWSPIIPSQVANKVSNGMMRNLGLTAGHVDSGAKDGSGYNSLGGFDYANEYSTSRVDLMRSSDAISFDFSVDPITTGSITGVSFDVQRPFDAPLGDISANTFQAAIFWKDANGVIQSGQSAAFTLAGTEWTTVNLDFTNFSASLPSDLGSTDRYLVEIYSYGGAGNNTVNMDNIALQGSFGGVAPQVVPEPGSAVLMLSAGIVCLFFRRRK